MRPFEEFMIRRHPAKLFQIDEMIILALNLARPHRPRRRGHGHGKVRLCGQKLSRNGGFARARWRGKNEEHATPLEIGRLDRDAVGHGR
jgi:hypothetical protein